MKIPLTLALSLFCVWGMGVNVSQGFTGEKSMDPSQLKKATFAGGCFWCMEPPFDKVEGVVSTVVGYTGGKEKNPTYPQVSSGQTGHCEAIEVSYDASKVSYEKLLQVFWRNIDPTTLNRQFADVGPHYRTEIFYHNAEQKKLALESKKKLDQSGRYDQPIVTAITSASEFYPAEEYHQDYYKKSSVRYKFYHFASGRGQYLEKIWGKDPQKVKQK